MAKQGLNFKLPIRVLMDLSDVSAIEFLFKQGNTEINFRYPAANASKRANENIIDLIWTSEMTYMFKAETTVLMDTKIFLVGSDFNPETPIKSFKFNRTLFEEA